jgi:nicotinamidase-related amidase
MAAAASRSTSPGEPTAFPVAGPLSDQELAAADTALFVIDMQVDFCAEGGMMERGGADIARLRAPIEPIRTLLAAARAAGLTIVHTREAYEPDLSNAPRTKRDRLARLGPSIGDEGPLGRHLIRGEPCWDFIPELPPLDGEIVIDKPGYGAFFRTDLEAILAARGIHHVLLTGVTTDCCVHSTLRQCEDLGLDAMVLEDCVATASAAAHDSTLDLWKTRGIFGTVGRSADAIAALAALAPRAS